MQRRVFITSGCLGLLSACGSLPSGQAPGSAGRPSLAAEQRRLATLFRGTPVVFAMQDDSTLRVDVPLRYCFDPGRSRVKPPLAAVLDRLATSQRYTPARWTVSGAGDAGQGASALASDRTASLRDYLMVRGIARGRLTLSPTVLGEGVTIVIRETRNTR